MNIISKKEIRIFLTSHGYFIGEVKSENETHVWLRDPGQVQIIPAPDKRSVNFAITEIVPPIFKNKDAIAQEFPLLKSNITVSGPAEDSFARHYEQYAAQQVKKRSGIEVVSGMGEAKGKKGIFPIDFRRK